MGRAFLLSCNLFSGKAPHLCCVLQIGSHSPALVVESREPKDECGEEVPLCGEL